MDDAVLTGWYVGWAIGGVVVLVVVVLVAGILSYARRIADQAQEITAALEDTRENTDPLWAVVDVNRDLERAVGGRPGPPHVLQERS